jgi:hypothetical protein
MQTYLKTAVMLCKMTRTSPSFLLHPLDFLGGEQVPELSFFPGMDLSGNRKIEIFHTVMETLSKHFKLVNMSVFAENMLKGKSLKVVES